MVEIKNTAYAASFMSVWLQFIHRDRAETLQTPAISLAKAKIPVKCMYLLLQLRSSQKCGNGTPIIVFVDSDRYDFLSFFLCIAPLSIFVILRGK